MKKAIKWSLLGGLVLAGSASLIVMISEPAGDVAFWRFITIKATALAVFAAVLLAGRACSERGWLPEVREEDMP